MQNIKINKACHHILENDSNGADVFVIRYPPTIIDDRYQKIEHFVWNLFVPSGVRKSRKGQKTLKKSLKVSLKYKVVKVRESFNGGLR